MDSFKNNRELMKSNFSKLKDIETDEGKKIEQPLLQKSYREGSKVFDLPEVTGDVVENSNIYNCLKDRRSVRKYIEEEMTQQQLSFLLWATQGVEMIVGKSKKAAFKTVPSGGARHAFETYLVLNRVEGFEKGLYRYLPISHQLLQLSTGELSKELVEAGMQQNFLANAALVFIWSCIPYRTEWRYNIAAHKTMLLDAGHVCQNLYIACEAIGHGTCAVASYEQELMDKFIGVDGEEEFSLYVAPVGKKNR